MVFQPDIKDMERHRVEFRLHCEKAKKRFALAQMLDVYEKILQDSLANASQNRPKENSIEINRITLDEVEKLTQFLYRLINMSQDASQRELVQESLRKSLIHARLLQQASGAQVDPMCLFCMGLFSAPIAQEHPPGCYGCSSPQMGGPLEDNNIDFDEAQRQPQHPPTPDQSTRQDTEPDQSCRQEETLATPTGDQQQDATQPPLEDSQQRRAQEPVPYQPAFNLPPSPEEDANIEGNQDNELSGDHLATPAATNGQPNSNGDGGHHDDDEGAPNNVHEDSFHNWFIESSRRADSVPRASTPLADFIEAQMACNFEAMLTKAEPSLKSERATIVEPVPVVVKRTKKKKGSKSSRAAGGPSSNGTTDRHQREAAGCFAAVASAVSVAQSQPISSIDLAVINSIKRAQSAASSQVVAPAGSQRDRLSNSKQFIKHTKKGKRRSTQIETNHNN